MLPRSGALPIVSAYIAGPAHAVHGIVKVCGIGRQSNDARRGRWINIQQFVSGILFDMPRLIWSGLDFLSATASAAAAAALWASMAAKIGSAVLAAAAGTAVPAMAVLTSMFMSDLLLTAAPPE
jgi:hypothetical protein